MVGYVNRVVQVAGKYTLDAPFEVGWGNTVLDVTPRGLRTPTFRQPGVAFTVHYRLLDGDVVIEADTGSRTVALAKGSVGPRSSRSSATRWPSWAWTGRVRRWSARSRTARRPSRATAPNAPGIPARRG
ncbi:DUF5996 family protein [Streptomyces cyaneofuscatus]|uniref:DUF5996 family protein n=1 Tax=Streptomyces cyaneofuscatus TaxID=66883 RepID=UPI00342AE5A1